MNDTINHSLLKLRMGFHSQKMAYSSSPKGATAATVGLTHGHWYVSPIQSTFLCADPFLYFSLLLLIFLPPPLHTCSFCTYKYTEMYKEFF